MQVPFVLEGEHGVYNFMKKRLDKNGLCVVVIAEGAGQVNSKKYSNPRMLCYERWKFRSIIMQPILSVDNPIY